MKCDCGCEFKPKIEYRHKLLCGDCRNPDDLNRLVGKEKVNGIFTSPPYAMQRKKQYGGIEPDKYVEWWVKVQENARMVLAEDGSFFVNIKPHCENGQRVLYVFDLVLAMVREWGWRFVDELCWCRKSGPKQVVHRFKNWFEPVYHFALTDSIKMTPKNVVVSFSSNVDVSRLQIYGGEKSKRISPSSRGGGVKAKGIDGAYPSNVIDTRAQGESSFLQPATFPLKLPTFFIKAYSDPGDIWLDPFCGSGTTVLAAHKENRRGLGIEILPKYVSVCLERLKDAGLKPKLIK